ncbi:ABC transporter permease [Kumtagia ephedrae]|uniref:Peptide ABC transporter permease n=1 Tax=Kumtagia ephedrae TaxID=2116701 RepID=A0A2P7RVG7_9HYPH|nr:ABC transporter permease [Mesorhizobium ephedrae]PSJ54193.1 peptide ABC transporter permease [Mesorhizobium ephedrae]
MLRYLAGRAAVAFFTLLGVSLATFFLIRLIPGDPILLLMPAEREISEERYQQLIIQFGFDRPLWEQYFRYIAGLFSGDLGISAFTRQPVLSEFMSYFPATIELALTATCFGLLLGVPAGMIAALARGTAIDLGLMSAALVGFSMPVFWWGMILITFFSGYLGWTPVSGRISVLYFPTPTTGFMLADTLLGGDLRAFWSALNHLILPTVTLGIIPLAIFARQTRSAMAEVLNEDYVRTARAKGLSEFRVVVVHALRNALIPVTTVVGLTMGGLLAGAILTETVFAWPGIGTWIVKAILSRDYQVIQGGILLIALVLILVNFAVDVLYGVLDPRIRAGGAS